MKKEGNSYFIASLLILIVLISLAIIWGSISPEYGKSVYKEFQLIKSKFFSKCETEFLIQKCEQDSEKTYLIVKRVENKTQTNMIKFVFTKDKIVQEFLKADIPAKDSSIEYVFDVTSQEQVKAISLTTKGSCKSTQLAQCNPKI